MNKIEKFIKENSLDFNDTGSSLNSVCTTISGYALHCGLIDVEILYDLICAVYPSTSCKDELKRVFAFAKSANYQSFWSTAKAKKMYKF
jgi:hypothetical protein